MICSINEDLDCDSLQLGLDLASQRRAGPLMPVLRALRRMRVQGRLPRNKHQHLSGGENVE